MISIISFSLSGQSHEGILLEHIKHANQIYVNQAAKIINLEQQVKLYESANTDCTNALIECNNRNDTQLEINRNLNQSLEYKDGIIREKNIQLITVSGIAAIILTYIIIK